MKKPTSPATMRSASSDWRTPAWLAAVLKDRYGPFDLDPAAAAGTSLGKRSYDRQDGGLEKPWRGVVYCNPPHARSQGETVGPWIRKALEELDEKRASRVVMLVPSRTDTSWWHDLVVQRAAAVLFIRGRLRFHGNGASSAAPFPSAVVIFAQRTPVGGPAYMTIAQPDPKKQPAPAPAKKRGRR